MKSVAVPPLHFLEEGPTFSEVEAPFSEVITEKGVAKDNPVAKTGDKASTLRR